MPKRDRALEKVVCEGHNTFLQQVHEQCGEAPAAHPFGNPEDVYVLLTRAQKTGKRQRLLPVQGPVMKCGSSGVMLSYITSVSGIHRKYRLQLTKASRTMLQLCLLQRQLPGLLPRPIMSSRYIS
jgi:hypothetical protein